MNWKERLNIFKSCYVPKKYFDQFVKEDSSYIINYSNYMIFKKDNRKGPCRGFTSLMYCVLYGRQDLIYLFQREIYMKTTFTNTVQINDEKITIPKDSTILHIAILTKNINIIKDVIKMYNQCSHNTDYTSLFQPNQKGKTNLNYIIESHSLQVAQTIFDLQYQPTVEFENKQINLFKEILTQGQDMELIILQYISTCARCFKVSEVLQQTLKDQAQEIYQLINDQINANENCLSKLQEVREIIDNLIQGKSKNYGCPQLIDDIYLDDQQLQETPQVQSLQSQQSLTTEKSSISQQNLRASIRKVEEVPSPQKQIINQQDQYMHRVISINDYAKQKEGLPKIESADTIYSCVSRAISYQDLANVHGLSNSESD